MTAPNAERCNEHPNQDNGGVPTGATRDVPGHTTFEYDQVASSDGPAPNAERCPACNIVLEYEPAHTDIDVCCGDEHEHFRDERWHCPNRHGYYDRPTLALARATAAARVAEAEKPWREAVTDLMEGRGYVRARALLDKAGE